MRHRQGRRGSTATKRDPGTRINEQIRVPEIRVIDEDGSQLGIMSPRDALRQAQERQLDLVEVAPNGNPPVCRIMNYGKYRYEQEKRNRQARKNQKNVEVKEIRLKPNMAEHDIDYRVRHAEEFLREGNKVRATVRFLGRQIIHTQLGTELLTSFADALAGAGVMEQPPRLDGRQMSIMLAPRSDAGSSSSASQ